jgi:hypothetical protein
MVLGKECDLPHPLFWWYTGGRVRNFIEGRSSRLGLEMERTQCTRDKILWELASHNGKLTRRVLRRRAGIKYADLDLSLEELDRDGKIRRTELGVDKKGLPKQMITLI